jgi:hypothetical protein
MSNGPSRPKTTEELFYEIITRLDRIEKAVKQVSVMEQEIERAEQRQVQGSFGAHEEKG